MNRTRIAAAIVAGIGLAAAITIAALVTVKDGNSDASSRARGAASPSASAPLDRLARDKTVQAVIVPLTQEEIDEALRIVSDDQNAKSILGLIANTGTSVRVVLLTSEGSTVRIGAAVIYTLENPIDLDLVLPKMDFDATDLESRARGYGLAQVHKRLQGLTKFTLQVDLSAKRVAGFQGDEYKADLNITGEVQTFEPAQ